MNKHVLLDEQLHELVGVTGITYQDLVKLNRCEFSMSFSNNIGYDKYSLIPEHEVNSKWEYGIDYRYGSDAIIHLCKENFAEVHPIDLEKIFDTMYDPDIYEGLFYHLRRVFQSCYRIFKVEEHNPPYAVLHNEYRMLHDRVEILERNDGRCWPVIKWSDGSKIESLNDFGQSLLDFVD